MGNIIKPNWYLMDRGSAALWVLMDQEYASQMPFDYIVGVVQGGLFPAMILSGLYDIPMIPAGIRPITDIDVNLTVLPEIRGELTSGIGKLPSPPPLLIVSDETSIEMNRVVKHYRDLGHAITTAALYYRDGGNGLKPDWFWNTIAGDDVVYYPWETHND